MYHLYQGVWRSPEGNFSVFLEASRYESKPHPLQFFPMRLQSVGFGFIFHAVLKRVKSPPQLSTHPPTIPHARIKSHFILDSKKIYYFIIFSQRSSDFCVNLDFLPIKHIF